MPILLRRISGLNFYSTLRGECGVSELDTLALDWDLTPLSVPLIFVSQIASVLSYGFDRFKAQCVGATGHSQGIAAALVLTSTKTWEDVYPAQKRHIRREGRCKNSDVTFNAEVLASVRERAIGTIFCPFCKRRTSVQQAMNPVLQATTTRNLAKIGFLAEIG